MSTITPRIATILVVFLSVTASASELAGLWTAKKKFGPDARGMLVVERRGGTYTADLAGRVVAVSAADGELTFTLPGGGGTFRGRLRGNARLMGKRGGRELEVATGTYDPEAEVITLVFPTRGGSYDFVRGCGEGDSRV